MRLGARAQAPALAALRTYGEAVGLAFQVVDDILDVMADSATLGKTPGKDAASDKPTYVSLLGLERAQDAGPGLACTSLCGLGPIGPAPDVCRPCGLGRHGGAQLALTSHRDCLASCVQIDVYSR